MATTPSTPLARAHLAEMFQPVTTDPVGTMGDGDDAARMDEHLGDGCGIGDAYPPLPAQKLTP